MGFIQSIIEHHRQKALERNDICNRLISRIDEALGEADSIFSDPQSYIDPEAATSWESRHKDILSDTGTDEIRRLKKALQYEKLLSRHNALADKSCSLSQMIASHNERVADIKLQAAYSIIGTVEKRKLDRQQMSCIIKDAHNHLVIAGAGTGKTTTIIGKIKYLLKTGKCRPEDILVLSFTNASATEMDKRILSETGCDIAASTFHKLGINILSRVNGKKPLITQINMRKFIKEQLEIHMQSDEYLKLLNSYLLYNRVIAKSEFDFHSPEEYDEYLKLNPPTTLNNETVKSYGEMDIANFLAQNGISYIYEQSYEIDTRTEQYGQYRPDFYLPDHKIYIEYFGINRKGEVPSYFKSKNGHSATEVYRESMEWKRALHRENHTTLIECYAYEKLDGNLQDALKQRLETAGVVLKPKSANELWNQIAAQNDSLLDGIIELFETLINLIKSNNYDIDTVRRLNCGKVNGEINDILLSLLEPIFNAYCRYLSEHEEIDFNDMINLATDYVKQGKYVNPYRCVIVDEYQDISKSRFGLLESLRQSGDYDLFCVGDDWQSIYRFAGSDVGFILNFATYWGASEISKIETTYRFSQKLIEISGNFIMQNPIQIKKSIKGQGDGFGFPLGEISGYTDKYAIEFMAEKLNDIPKGSSVFFIGRYTFDSNLLNECDTLSCQYNNESGHIDVKSQSRPDLKMMFLTAHKSKGLQADYVFIINNKRARMGFPSKVQDAPILELLLDNCDRYPYAEERRLFYVALTRAKKKVYIVTVKGQESEFATELKEKYGDALKKERFECPICGGRLVRRSGPYGEFFGCSNYSKSGCTYKRKINSLSK